MGLRERDAARRADIAQRESDHQRWADDGGFIPKLQAVEAAVGAVLRHPWAVVGVAAAVGFALGWVTGRR
jgi:ElaB/YqjD/DUF883 family membrane-anchored ribosome-binding protein